MSSEQIRTKPFLTERKGGYNKDEVVAFLEEVADEFEALQSRMGEVESASDPAVIAELDDLRAKLASHDGLQDALEKAYADVEQLRTELGRAREERDALSQKLTTSTDPTAAIGEEVAMVLRAAKEAANELKDRAERESAEVRSDAEQARSAAEGAAARLRADAEAQAADIVAQARREADDLLSRETARYEELLAAQGEVARRLEDAESVLRSVRDRLSSPSGQVEPAPEPQYQPEPEAVCQPEPEYQPEPQAEYHQPEPQPEYHQSEYNPEPQPEQHDEPQAQVTASDWFNQPSDEQPQQNGSTQEFAG
ncbi:MAG: DivIVA domain-containing protein [Actinomycetota bacterium]